MSAVAAARLEYLASEIRSHLERTVESIIEVGKLLNEARTVHSGDAEFGQWCKAEFPTVERHTLQNFRNVAKKFGGELFSTEMAPTVLYLLAAPSTPDEAVEEVIEKAQAGEKVSVKEAKEIIKKHVKEASADPVEPIVQMTLEEHRERLLDRLMRLTKEQRDWFWLSIKLGTIPGIKTMPDIEVP